MGRIAGIQACRGPCWTDSSGVSVARTSRVVSTSNRPVRRMQRASAALHDSAPSWCSRSTVCVVTVQETQTRSEGRSAAQWQTRRRRASEMLTCTDAFLGRYVLAGVVVVGPRTSTALTRMNNAAGGVSARGNMQTRSRMVKARCGRHFRPSQTKEGRTEHRLFLKVLID